MSRFPNWNWDDGTPEDGPRIQPRFDEAEIATMREFPEEELNPTPNVVDQDTIMFCADLLKKHDELAKMMGFPTEVVWLEVPAEEIKDLTGSDQATRIFTWDGEGNYHEIVCDRIEATLDACRIRFIRESDEIEINVFWTKDA